MSEKASVIVHFPVRPHVYKYLQKKCGEKLTVTKNDFFGSTILDILSKNYSEFEKGEYSLTYPVEISFQYMNKMGIYIDSRIIGKFNARFDKLFREEMRTYCAMNYESNGIPKETSLKQIIYRYNMTEDDIKYETLLKDVRRNT